MAYTYRPYGPRRAWGDIIFSWRTVTSKTSFALLLRLAEDLPFFSTRSIAYNMEMVDDVWLAPISHSSRNDT